MKGLLVLISLVSFVGAMEFTDSFGNIETLDDGSQVLQTFSPMERLAFERIRTLWRISDNPFDCWVFFSQQVWPTEVMTFLVKNMKINDATITYHKPGTLLGSSNSHAFHLSLDIQAWMKKEDPIPWILPKWTGDDYLDLTNSTE